MAIAQTAAEVNSKTENIGARRLHTILEKLLEDISFEADGSPRRVVIDEEYVKVKLETIAKDDDLSRVHSVGETEGVDQDVVWQEVLARTRRFNDTVAQYTGFEPDFSRIIQEFSRELGEVCTASSGKTASS